MHKSQHRDYTPFSIKLIRFLCKPELIEEIEGNLLEFRSISNTEKSPFRKLKYWYQVMNYLRPATLKSYHINNQSMFIFNPLLTARNLLRHKATSLINVFGFTLGLVSSIFLYFYIYSEMKYDSFHEEGNQIYRVARLADLNGDGYAIGVTSGPYAEALKNDFPGDISEVVRVQPDNGLVTYGEKRFFESDLLFADGNFFEFFSYPLAVGDPSEVLKDANSVVLTKDAAKKYFGDSNPIGEILEVDNEYQFKVTGIIDDLPAKSSIEFDMVFSLQMFNRFSWFGDWWSNGLLTFVKVKNPEQVTRIIEQLPAFMDKYFGDDFEESGRRMDLTLEPLSDIYFNNETRYDFVKHGDLKSIYILGLVAIAILFIACFNYVNLSIAQSFMRAKEVSVRKVLGVYRRRLVMQFLGESLMILIISILLSIGLCQLLNPLFNSLLGLEINLNWMDPNVITFFFSLIALVLISSGVYPALLLSSFKPVKVLKGGKLTSGKNSGLRKGLVILQFSISIFMIVATILINVQTDYLNSKDLGFDKEATVILNLNNREIRADLESFKARLKENSNVSMVAGMSGEPGGFFDTSGFLVTGVDGNTRMRTLFVDRDYLKFFGLDVVAGRDFSTYLITDENQVMIFNEAGAKELGLVPEEVIGRKATMPGWDINDAPIVGIVKDFHFESLKSEIEPLAIITGGRPRKLAIKVNAKNINETLLFIDEKFKEISPKYPISYSFLDEKLERLYEDQRKQARVFSAFSGISILLACMGIFGLATYSAQQRQKELGIRKVLGASPNQIINLISKEFMILVLLATLVATPVVYAFIDNWLGDFAYRINLSTYWFIFLLGGLVALVIALLTITIKTYRTAVSEPTETIRNE